MRIHFSTAGRSLSIAIVALALAACIDQGGIIEPQDAIVLSRGHELQSRRELAMRLAGEEMLKAVNGDNSRGIESDLLRLSSLVPGFGGAYFDPDEQRVVAFATQESQHSAVVAALREFHSQMASAIGTDPDWATLLDAPIEMRNGSYTFQTLVGWSRALLFPLLDVDGFVGIDADERLNRVRIVVEHAAAASSVEQILSAVEAPIEMIHLSEGKPLYDLLDLRDYIRPAGGGLQVWIAGAAGACSFGWTVSGTPLSPDLGWLTAGHCHPSGGGHTGATAYQPTTASGTYEAGYVHTNPAWNDPGCVDPDTGLPWGGLCTDADVMLVSVDQLPAGTVSKRVARTTFVGLNSGIGSIVISDWWSDHWSAPIVDPIGSWDFYVGNAMNKVGQKTGWTRGTVAASCGSYKIYNPSSGAFAVKLCLGEVSNIGIGGGDSGGPVFTGGVGSPVFPKGIVTGGSSPTFPNDYCSSNCTMVFTRGDRIENRLGMNLDFN